MSLTAANSVFTLAISGLFSTPQTLKGYSADNLLGMETRSWKSGDAAPAAQKPGGIGENEGPKRQGSGFSKRSGGFGGGNNRSGGGGSRFGRSSSSRSAGATHRTGSRGR